MTRYLQKLRALVGQNPAVGQPPKLPKVDFGSNGSSEGSGFYPSERGEGRELYDPEALQRRADTRNQQAASEGRTDRYCRCGRLAKLAWPCGGRREMWRCEDCVPTRGRA